MTDRPAVAIYAALSRKKTKRDDDRADEESVESQIAKVRARLVHLYGEDGFDLLDRPFKEVGYSGSKKNRGPELELAIAAVTTASDDGRKVVELWANTSARFARGTGKRDEARAIGELFYDLRRRGVALRTVEDDEFVTNEMLVGFASAQASKYAKDLSESVTRAKRRQAEAGVHLGGPLPLGLLKGEKPSDPPIIDPATERTARRILELALEGVPDTRIARIVNAEGHRSRHGRPFDRRSIQAIVLNPLYAGLIVYDGEEHEARADYPRLIDPADWHRMVATRQVRDLAEPSQKKVGRPAQNHALARLAVCGRCGERLFAKTSSYRRKSDGGRARSYVCHAYQNGTGLCDAKPIDAEVVDAAVISGLDTLLVDFEAWRRRIEDSHSAERDRLAGEVERAQADHDAQAHKASRVEAKWAEYVGSGDDAKAELVLPIVERERQARLMAEQRLQAGEDALALVPTEAPTDAMLDFATALQEAISGRVNKTDTMAEVNQALRELFSEFRIEEREEPKVADVIDRTREERSGGLPFSLAHPERDDVAALPADLKRTVIRIQPFLRPDTAERLAGGAPTMVMSVLPDEPPPPLRWLEPSDPHDPSPTLRETCRTPRHSGG